uniref:Caspase domain-containing protein n=1 Tax=Candidatus Kentrum sp. TUN TaxID=2126343 RepID=A0A451A793_9GAMM|nr:MAG: Caspase domain-containing protein [Candidatus Kentron sp. TUN]
MIGNGDYQQLDKLANPKRDAQAVAQRLSGLGFTLFDANGKKTNGPVYDLTQAHFFQALRHFADRARNREIALVYYAGHGIQIQGESYLLPVDTPKDDVELVERRAVALDRKILQRLDNRARLTVAIFDACREIPKLKRTMARSRSSGIGMDRGLALVKSRGTGRIIAYSAAAGQLTADGHGNHSPYTSVLLEQLDKNPRQSVEDLFAQVAFDFRERHGGQQPEVLNQGVKPNHHYLKPPPDESKRIHKPLKGAALSVDPSVEITF